MFKRFHEIILIGAVAIVILYFLFKGFADDPLILSDHAVDTTKFKTNLGEFSLSNLNKLIYQPIGYKISKWCDPVPCLTKIDRLHNLASCKKVYNDWLNIANQYDKNSKPPRYPPPDLLPKFTLNNHVPVKYKYMNDKLSTVNAYWDKKKLNRYFNSTQILSTYADGSSVYHSTKKHSIIGKEGMVIGSINPWVESICLKNGAKKLTTVDYFPNLKIDSDQMFYINALNLGKEIEKYYESMDFVVSFSSIEHSGLGRFGDPLDPIGDIREVEKIWCLLKPNGLLFLGIPVARDMLEYNLHRIYGFLRLPLMFQGYVLLETYYSDNPEPLKFSKELIDSSDVKQYLFVLQKQ